MKRTVRIWSFWVAAGLLTAFLNLTFLSSVAQARMADENADNPTSYVDLSPSGLYIERQLDLDTIPLPQWLPISLTNSNQDAAIGHYIKLRGVYIDAGGKDDSVSVTDWHWTIPGTPDRVVKSYLTTPSTGQSTSLTDFNSRYIYYYWISTPGQRDPQAIDLTARSLDAKATIYTWQPYDPHFNVVALGTTGVSVSSSYRGGLALHFGANTNYGTPGLTWNASATMPVVPCPGALDGRGQIAVFQLINTARTMTSAGGQKLPPLTTNGNYVLDNTRRYQGPEYKNVRDPEGAGALATINSDDSPGIWLANYSAVGINDNFTDNLMYRPGGKQPIYVSIMCITNGWKWSGTTQKDNNGQWSPANSSNSYASGGSLPTSYSSVLPQWTTSMYQMRGN